MRRSTCRRFTLRDAMILTAAAAASLGLMRMCWPKTKPDNPLDLVVSSKALAGVGMLAWTLAFLPLRLIGPRRPLDRLMCQLGMAGCCAASLVILIRISVSFLYSIRERASSPGSTLSYRWFLHFFLYANSPPIGPAVAATWLALILSGRWRPERGWIDRLGFGIGAFWIAFTLLQDELIRWIEAAIDLLTQ